MKPDRGALILVMGILGLVCCGVFGIFAWVMGANDLKEMDAGTMDSEGRGLTQAGKFCGMISTGLLIIGLIAVAVLHMLGYSLEQMKHMTDR
jgi:hypothetical protein